jgi:predicted NBD/HSP70 family sugar kinase
MAFTRAAVGRIRRKHKSIPADRVVGLGIASPFYQWDWDEEIRGPDASKIRSWQEIDIRAELDHAFDWPVYLFNDATVSAGAELMFGIGIGRPDFLYAYVGHFVGGALVVDHHLFPGRNNLAGALGKVVVPGKADRPGRLLAEVASLHALEQKLDGRNDDRIWSSPVDWSALGPAVEDWIDDAADGFACAIQNTVALLDIDNVVIDGCIPAPVRKELARAIRRRLAKSVTGRPEPLSILEGTFGVRAPSIGGASIPLLVRYSNDKDLLFKD